MIKEQCFFALVFISLVSLYLNLDTNFKQMKQVISTENRPIKMWLDDIEENALSQAKNLANLPFLHKHVALMPDAHSGYGMPIGGVLAAKGVVIPNAVGVDIGCGMCALKTNIDDLDTDTLKQVMSQIRSRIPLGFNSHKQAQKEELLPQRDKLPHRGGTKLHKGFKAIRNTGRW